jgi:hypothetical protein
MKTMNEKFKWGDGGVIRLSIDAKKIAVCGEPPAKGDKKKAKKPETKPAAKA